MTMKTVGGDRRAPLFHTCACLIALFAGARLCSSGSAAVQSTSVSRSINAPSYFSTCIGKQGCRRRTTSAGTLLCHAELSYRYLP